MGNKIDPQIEYIGLLYGRASKDVRKKGTSVTAQLRDLRYDYANYGWPIQREYRDDDRSASTYARKARDDFNQMVEDVRTRKGLTSNQRHVIGAWEASRLSRDLEVFFALRRACKETAALIYVDSELYDMQVSKDRQRLTEMVLKAESEADGIQARNARTARLIAADCGIYGPVQYGYRREYDPNTGALLRQVPDEGTPGGITPAENVRVIFRSLASGVGIDALKRQFEGAGIPNPSGGPEWGRATVRFIATNWAYLGFRVHKGEVIGKGPWEPLLKGADEQAFHTVQGLLRDPNRHRHHGMEPAHLLSYIAQCGYPGADEGSVCGSPLERMAGYHTDPPKRTYACRKTGCRRIAIHMGHLDDYVQALLLAWLEVPGRLDRILEQFQGDDVSEVLAEIARLEAELKEAHRLAAARQLSLAGLASAEAGLLPALDAARSRVNSSVPEPALLEVVGPDARAKWAAMEDMRQKRNIVRAVVEIHVLPQGDAPKAPKGLPQRVRTRWLLGA